MSMLFHIVCCFSLCAVACIRQHIVAKTIYFALCLLSPFLCILAALAGPVQSRFPALIMQHNYRGFCLNQGIDALRYMTMFSICSRPIMPGKAMLITKVRTVVLCTRDQHYTFLSNYELVSTSHSASKYGRLTGRVYMNFQSLAGPNSGLLSRNLI